MLEEAFKWARATKEEFKGTLTHLSCKHLTIILQSFNQTVSSHIKGQTLLIRTAKFKRIHRLNFVILKERRLSLRHPYSILKSLPRQPSISLMLREESLLVIRNGSTWTTCCKFISKSKLSATQISTSSESSVKLLFEKATLSMSYLIVSARTSSTGSLEYTLRSKWNRRLFIWPLPFSTWASWEWTLWIDSNCTYLV